MKQLQVQREARGWSKLRLSQEAHVAPSIVGQAESGRRIPYAPELARLASALSWQGDPAALLHEVTFDATAEPR